MASLITLQAAVMLQVSERAIRAWLRSGKLRGARLGGTRVGWRLPLAEVERLLRGEVS